ncbi:hypothetical protein STA3757_27090 [Stanieria sp. NIES-3757]|nr:hypothetical protein STA3757_27090 [Stanieria sp. NIES-3757]
MSEYQKDYCPRCNACTYWFYSIEDESFCCENCGILATDDEYFRVTQPDGEINLNANIFKLRDREAFSSRSLYQKAISINKEELFREQ